MATTIPGSEIFAYKGNSAAAVREKASRHLKLQTASQSAIEKLDPLTYEVIRHRLWMTTQDMGDALKNMSGSIVVVDSNDFNFVLTDETGNPVSIGPYNVGLGVAVESAIKWTLENRAENPGIEDGDMFLCNDPWVGGGLHQNDVAVYAPLFWEGELFGWSSASSHQLDLGGVAPGSWTPRGRSVFWESLPTPPVKIVRGNQIQRDVEDLYLRRSRIPRFVGLDLRAQIGANNFAHARLRTLIAKYGPETVKAVMARMMDDTERRVRAKLRELPDGTWKSVAYQEEAREGDRGLYKIVLNLTKRDDRMTFDFRGTDPQVEGLINCTYSGLSGGILWAALPVLCGDIPWAAGGLMRCFDIISEEGTLNNATYPAGVSKASVASGWATANAVLECLSKMVDAHAEHRKTAMAVCAGTWSLAVLSGVDQYERPFVTILMDPMAAGLGARVDSDGVDSGGVIGIVMGRTPDVEMVEFMNPLLYLWRREEVDSGGPGRYRGGVSASLCAIPHNTESTMNLVVSGSGKAVNMNVGLHGGYPGNSQLDVTIRGSNARELLSRGIIPEHLDEIAGEVEYQPSEKETHLDPNDVHYVFWQGGGGWGDPLLRAPTAVAHDVAELRVSVESAREIYGVVIKDREVDATASERRRHRIRADRGSIAKIPTNGVVAAGDSSSDLNPTPLNNNLVAIETASGQVLTCGHCDRPICPTGEPLLPHLALIESVAQAAGPRIFAEPWRYIDEPVVFRQFCCPGCFTVFASRIVPRNHPVGFDFDSPS